MDSTVSQLGPAGAAVVIVLLFLKFLREDRDRRDQSYKQMAKALDKNAKAVKLADIYLRERNGRDNEFHERLMAVITPDLPNVIQSIVDASAKKIIESVGHVEHQEVHQQVVHNEVKEVEAIAPGQLESVKSKA